MSKLTLAAAAGAVIKPAFAQDAAKPQIPQFKFDHAWAKLPEGHQLGVTHGVAVDSQDRVYIAHMGLKGSKLKDCILVFDQEGKLINSWGPEYAQGAHGLDIFTEEDGTEILYLTDLKRGLFKMTLKGEIIWHMPKPPSTEGEKIRWRPSNVAVTDDGTVYLADGYGSHRIFVLDKNGKEISHFGGTGDHEVGKTFHPHGLWIDRRPGCEPLLIIGENYNRSEKQKFHGVLLRYTLDGKYHDTIKTKHELISPRHYTSYGETLTIPDLDGRVTMLDKDFNLIGHVGDIALPHDEIREIRKNDTSTHPEGKFVCPHDAAYDSKGNLYVAEWVVGGRITRLSPS